MRRRRRGKQSDKQVLHDVISFGFRPGKIGKLILPLIFYNQNFFLSTKIYIIGLFQKLKANRKSGWAVSYEKLKNFMKIFVDNEKSIGILNW
jgi:hypothetical protein